MSYTYQYPRPSVTVDTIIVAKPAAASRPPQGQWALPGGFVDKNEPLYTAAARELQEETSVKPESVNLIQTGAYGDPGRDPRGWCVTVAYAALVPSTDIGAQAADDAADARWFSLTSLPQPLAFDHKLVLREALQKLARQEDVQQTGLADQLLQGAATLEGPWTPPTE
eukprot:gene6786-7003_t